MTPRGESVLRSRAVPFNSTQEPVGASREV